MSHTLILNRPASIASYLTLKQKFSFKALVILSFASILALLVFYIVQVNAFTQEIYLVQDQERKLSQLSGENEVLNINFSKSASLENIEKYLLAQNFKKVSQVKYIQILESSVVARPTDYRLPVAR